MKHLVLNIPQIQPILKLIESLLCNFIMMIKCISKNYLSLSPVTHFL